MMIQPNVLVIMTDEERYPTAYETDAIARFRREQLPARERVRSGGVELHRHYVGSTACVPSRATLFTGQYPSLHGVSQTDGVAKEATDPAMRWLRPGVVPTMGDWFRAGGYDTHYRGKWHISHADLPAADGHGLAASDDEGRVIPAAVAAYREADRLDPYGFSGWIGREPHGAAKDNSGSIRDSVFAEQVCDLFDDLADMGTTEVTADVIVDFGATDVLDLSGLDANTDTVGDDAFATTLVVGAFTAAGQLRFDNGVLFGNTDSDFNTVEFVIRLTGVTSLATGDFVA